MTSEGSGGSDSDSTAGDDSDLRSAMAARLRDEIQELKRELRQMIEAQK